MLRRSDLRPYQERAAEFVREHERCALWVDMGLGKTVSTLTAYVDLRNRFDAGKMLVVGPLRVARKVWPDEIGEWEHTCDLSVQKITGSEKARWSALRTPADVHVVNRENLDWLVAQFVDGNKQVRRFPWDTVVLDESQSFKHQSSLRWKAANKVSRMAPRMVQLTGTPAPNGYGDLWGQIYLLDRGQRLGASEKAFRDRWFDADRGEENYTRWWLKPGADKAIQKALADIVLTLRVEDYLDLPDVMYNEVRVELPPAVMAAYKEFERERLLELADTQLSAVNAAAIAGKLLQFANGAVYHDDAGNWTELHDAKLRALGELLEDSAGPVLLAYAFKHDLARIAKLLKSTKLRWAVLDSEATERRWNDGGLDVLVLHPESGGHGLNLHKSGAETIIWFGLTPNLEHYDQLNARLIGGHRRVGRNVVVHHIIADGTRDARMLSLLRGKSQTQGGLKEALRSLGRE